MVLAVPTLWIVLGPLKVHCIGGQSKSMKNPEMNKFEKFLSLRIFSFPLAFRSQMKFYSEEVRERLILTVYDKEGGRKQAAVTWVLICDEELKPRKRAGNKKPTLNEFKTEEVLH